MLRSMGISLFTLILAVSLAGSVGFGCPVGDLSGNCEVNAQDLLMFAEHWLDKNCSDANCGDLDGVPGVNGFDFAKFAETWGTVGENGSLQVTISPEQAIDDGAQWRVDGGTWRDSGYEETGLSVGLHRLDFSVIFGWTEPDSITVNIEDGITTSESKVYVQQTGSLKVTISPEEVALNPEAKWRVDGGTWRDSEYTESPLSVGWHTVEFSVIEGWAKPLNKTVVVLDGQTTPFNGVHTKPLVISEFMAINNSQEPLEPGEILDDFGESSDWVEIYNPTGTNISLEDWYLTDDANNLTKWQFPTGTEIDPGEFLIVFASKRNLRNPAKPLHTNFKLDGDEEYLGLVLDDGVTIVHEYAPEYPEQVADISYGLVLYSSTLVPVGATVSYHVPTIADKDANWTALDFNDSDWNIGETGLGFGFGGAIKKAYNDCVFAGNQYKANNVTTYAIGSVYSGPEYGPLIDQATGEEMGVTATFTQSGGVNWQTSTISGGRDCDTDTDAYETFGGIADMTGVINYGNTGWWVDLTFTGLNTTTEYTFATSACRNYSSYTNRITLYTISGADTYTNASTDGADILSQEQVRFITGDNFDEGYVARWTGITATDGNFKVRAEADDYYRAYSFDVFMLQGGFSGSDLQNQMQNVNASLWTRIKFNLEEGEPDMFDTLTLRMKYEDGFIAYLNGQKVAERNAPTSPMWDSCADANRPVEEASVFEQINLMSYKNSLRVGTNVLAIHALNDDKANGQFLILPELVAASNITVPQYFTSATPGKINIPGAKGRVKDVWFSNKRGFYDDTFRVGLTTDTPGAKIRYTVNGSRPTASSGTLYRIPRMISKTSILRAVASKPGYLDSRVGTHTYIFVNDVVQQDYQATLDAGFPEYWDWEYPDYGMDPDVVDSPLYNGTIKNDLKSIPTLSIVMNINDMFGSNGIYSHPTEHGLAWERPTSAELIYPDANEEFQVDCGIRIQGGAFRRFSLTRKKSLRLLFKSIYGPTKLEFPFFGEDAVDSFDTIILRAGANDGYAWSAAYLTEQYTRDEFGRSLQLAAGHKASHGNFVHLYINGIYWGLYNPVERPDDSFCASYMGGEKEEWDSLKTPVNNNIEVLSGSIDAWNDMLAQCRAGLSTNSAYQKIQGNNPDGTPNPAYPNLLDASNYIDYMILNLWGGNWDWPRKNFYFARRQGPLSTGFKFFNWDFENTMGNNRSRSPLYMDAPLNWNGVGEPHVYLRQNADYLMLFADHVHKLFFNGGILTPESLISRYTEMADHIERAMVGESARWGDEHHHPPLTLQEWYNERNWMLNTYLPLRPDIVLGQFIGDNLYPTLSAPTLSQYDGWDLNGFTVTMSPLDDTIYYTTNGSDPRLPGGAVNTPGAQEYSGGNINLTQTTHLKARVLDGGTWSALSEAVFAVGPVTDNLRITEMMYHPPDTGAPEDPNAEYIELKNISETTDLNLNLVKFTNGIDFTFPNEVLGAGDYVIVAKDPAVFAVRYPDIPADVNTLGPYYGRLDNGGERIELEDANGQTILNFRYRDGWRSITDGRGFSLTIIDPTNSDPNSWEEKDSWRASAYPGGSPGADDSDDTHNPGSIVINEVMAHSHDYAPDWIELYNTTGSSIDIGGWFLSDSDSNLMKYEIANSTVIDPYQYELFYENEDFNNPSDPGYRIGFALSENGEVVSLTAAQGEILMGYREREDFGASERDISFGRYHKGSTGNYNFVAMDSNTPGWKNDYPKVGPLIINEIMYNPKQPQGSFINNDEYEYIELLNISGEPIMLYCKDKAASWRFTDGIDFTFPAGPNEVTIPKDGLLLVVKNPSIFASRYGDMPPDVNVLGPYSGRLNNAGETVEISKPGDIDVFGDRHYIRIDRVNYSDGSHPQDCPGGVDLWPTQPDGQGASLSRIDPNLYGNDPNNWTYADPPTPGG